MLCTKANFTSSSARSFRVNRRKKFKPSRKTLKLAFIYRTHRAVLAYAFDCEQSPSRVMLFEDTSSDLMLKINRRRASSDWCNEMHNNDRRRADNRQWQAIVNCSVWEMNEQINLNAKRSLISLTLIKFNYSNRRRVKERRSINWNAMGIENLQAQTAIDQCSLSRWSLRETFSRSLWQQLIAPAWSCGGVGEWLSNQKLSSGLAQSLKKSTKRESRREGGTECCKDTSKRETVC